MKYVLVIGEKDSSWAGRPPVASTHTTREEAEAELDRYIRRNWESEMDGQDMPEDASEMVEQYFEAVPERYEIVTTK